jgi:hypothetical protein
MQKEAAMALKLQRRLTAAALKGHQEAIAALDLTKKESIEAQQRLRDESAAALKEQEIRKSEEAAAHLKQVHSEATREKRILQATLSQEQEEGSRIQQEAEAGRLECQLPGSRR